MAEELPGLTSKVTIDPSGVDKGLDQAISKIHRFSGDADRSFSAFSKRVNAEFAKISGQTATEKLRVIEQAIAKAGGAANIAAPQLDRLRKQVSALVAEGGKLPSALAGLEQSTSKLGGAGMSFLQGGGISGALTAIGPAGIAAAASLGAVAGAAKLVTDQLGALIDKTSRLSDLSEQTNISAESLQKLAYAGKLVGVSLEEISRGAAIMARNLVDAPEKFEALGLSAQALRNMKPEEQFAQIAEAIKGIENPTLQAHAAMEVFGKGGAALLPLLKSDIGAAAAEAEKLGFVLGDDVVKAGDKLGDELTKLSKSWEGLKDQLVAVIATNPEVIQGLQDTVQGVGALAKAIKDNKAIFDFLFKQSFVGAALAGKKGADDIAKFIGAMGNVPVELPDVSKRIPELGKAPSLGAEQAKIAKDAAKEVGDSVEEMEKKLAKLVEERKKAMEKAAAEAKKATEKAAAEARKAAAELERQVGPSAQKAQEEMDKLAKAVEETGGAFDRTQASYDTIINNLERLEKQGAKVAPILKEVQEAAIPKLPSQRDLGAIGGFVPGAVAPPVATGDVTALLQERMRAGLSTVTFLQQEFGFTETAARELEAQVLKTMEASAEGAKETTEATFDWGQALEDVSNLFNVLGINADSALGKVLGGVTGAFTAVDKIGDALGKGFKGFLSGGGVTGIVAAVGVVTNLVSAFKKPEHEKVMEGVGRDYGVKISEGLGKQIAEDSKKLGDRTAATLKNLGAIIGEAGGVKAFGIEKSIAKTRDLFSQLEQGKLSAAEVGKTFDEVFGKILPEAVDKTTGLVSTQFKELIALSQRFGVESKGVTDFLTQQAQSAGSSLAEAIKGGITSEAGAAGFGAAIAAQFDELVRRTGSQRAALEQLQPAIDAMRTQLEETGLSGGAAFDAIAAKAALLSDEVAGPVIAKVDAITQSLVALDNQSLLTQDIFTGLTTEVGAAFQKLEEGGQSGPAALAVLQPSLQRIFELQRQYGYAVDESTQKLLDQAEQAGLVGEEHQDATTRMIEGIERVGDVLEAVAKKLGADLPDAARRGAQGIEDAFGGISIPTPGMDVSFRAPGGMPEFTDQMVANYQKGGVRDFGQGTLAMLHGREAVVPAEGGAIVEQLAHSIADAIPGAPGTSPSSVTLVNNTTIPVNPLGLRQGAETFFAEIEQRQAAAVRAGNSELVRALRDKGLV
jgi:hypothetical protein